MLYVPLSDLPAFRVSEPMQKIAGYAVIQIMSEPSVLHVSLPLSDVEFNAHGSETVSCSQEVRPVGHWRQHVRFKVQGH